MPVEGVDYSYDRPDLNQLYAAGKRFIVRYLSDEPAKNLTRAEADAAAKAGHWLVVVWEASEGQELPDAAWSATESIKQAKALGVPAGRPIYFAVDWDAQPGEYDEIEDFLRYYNDKLAPYVAGVYGGENVVEEMRRRGAVEWLWQTYAWSNALISPEPHMQQYKNNIELCGGLVDLDRAYSDDYGQWQPNKLPVIDTDTGEDWFEMATQKDLEAAIDARLKEWLPRMLNVYFNGKANSLFPAGTTIALDGMGITGRLDRAVNAGRTGKPNSAFPNPGSPKD